MTSMDRRPVSGCVKIRMNDGSLLNLCGSKLPRCGWCALFADFLCDHKDHAGLTCDAHICPEHATKLSGEAFGKDICPDHAPPPEDPKEVRAGRGVIRGARGATSRGGQLRIIPHESRKE